MHSQVIGVARRTCFAPRAASVGVTLMGLVILCAPAATHASIITRNVDVTLSAANLDSYNLDVNLDGTTDFTFDAAYVPDPVLTVGFDQIDFPFGSVNGAVIDTQTNDGFPPTSLLGPGATISSSSLFCQSGDKADLFYYDTIDPQTGNFGGKTGDVGFQFAAADGTHYGFAQISVNDLNDPANPLDLTIGSVSYNSVAGQPISVPEPASLGVVGLVSLAGLRSLRRRK